MQAMKYTSKGIHTDFETQGSHHQKYISGPTKRTYVLHNSKKLKNTGISWKVSTDAQLTGVRHLSVRTVCRNEPQKCN